MSNISLKSTRSGMFTKSCSACDNLFQRLESPFSVLIYLPAGTLR